MGYLRFLLAYLVLLSHVGVYFKGHNQGVIAVTIFYILAGHVVSKLFEEKMDRNLFLFYRDRLLRIFPSYIFIYSITLLFLLISGFGSPDFQPIKLILNLLIIPLNYYMYIPELINILKDCSNEWYLIPPAWSLGTELQVYILLPFILNNRKLFFFTFWTSFCIFSAANLELINSDIFGYRLILGTFFIFLIGSLLQRTISGSYKKLDIFTLGFSYLALLIWYIYFILYKGSYGIYSRETILGILIGVPLVFTILRFFKRKSKINIFFGDLSYPIFLSHFLAIWILQYLLKCKIQMDIILMTIFVSVVSIIISLITVVLIDKKIKNMRLKNTN